MADQGSLFGFKDMTPWAKKGVKKVITKERLVEVQRLLDNKDGRGAAEKLREMNEGLERFERRISNQKNTADCVGKSAKTVKRSGN